MLLHVSSNLKILRSQILILFSFWFQIDCIREKKNNEEVKVLKMRGRNITTFGKSAIKKTKQKCIAALFLNK